MEIDRRTSASTRAIRSYRQINCPFNGFVLFPGFCVSRVIEPYRLVTSRDLVSMIVHWRVSEQGRALTVENHGRVKCTFQLDWFEFKSYSVEKFDALSDLFVI